MFWRTTNEAYEHIRADVSLVDVVFGYLEECAVLFGKREQAAAALLEAGVDLSVAKQGPAGPLGARRGESVIVPLVPVEVVNGPAAGHAFGGALCRCLLAGWDVARVLRFTNAGGSVVAGQLACADATPATAELEAPLVGGPT